MAPSAKTLEAALIDATCQVYKAEPDATTVNKVRKLAEENLDLDDGFFTSAAWKQKSKVLIKEYVEKLLDGWERETKEEEEDLESKNGVKRQSSEPESPAPKRRKRSAQGKNLVKDESSELSELSDPSDEDEKPKRRGKGPNRLPKKSAKKFPQKRAGKSKRVVSEDEEEEDIKTTSASDRKRKRKAEDESDEEKPTKPLVIDTSKFESTNGDSEDEETKPTKPLVTDTSKFESTDGESKDTEVKKRRDSEDDTKGASGGTDIKDASDEDDTKGTLGRTDSKSTWEEDGTKGTVDEEEEYSDVIDEPQPNRKKEKKESSSKKPAKSTGTVKKAPSPDDPNEAEIKKLQGQLVKCGVRKLWHNELKKYGSDARAKIRHLKRMLAEIGMDGRFSEAKAREIKETRELMAEAEAAQEMNALWGMDAGGRASRSKSKGKTMKVDESEDEEEGGGGGAGGDDDDDGDEDPGFAARKRGARADLAFLGDESESD